MNFSDLTNYKNCRKKQYECWICKPPIGTAIVNNIAQNDILLYLKQYLTPLNKRCFLYKEEVDIIKEQNPQVYNTLVSYKLLTDSTNCMVVCGTLGELRIASYADICNNYLMFNNETYTNIPKIINDRLEKYNNEDVLPWYKAISSPSNVTLKACFVPKKEKVKFTDWRGTLVEVNGSNIDHGKGDFIVGNGRGYFELVNGIVFSNTYDNRGWSDEISIGHINFNKPMDLYVVKDNKPEDTTIEWFRSHDGIKFASLLSNNQNFYKKIKDLLTRQINYCTYLESKYGLKPNLEQGEDYINDTNLSFNYDAQYDILCEGDTFHIVVVSEYSKHYVYAFGFSYNEESEYCDDPYEGFSKYTKDEFDDAVEELSKVRKVSNFDTLVELFKTDKCLSKCLSTIELWSSHLADSINNNRPFAIVGLRKIVANVVTLFKDNTISDAGVDYNPYTKIFTIKLKPKSYKSLIELNYELFDYSCAVPVVCKPDVNNRETFYDDYVYAEKIDNLRKLIKIVVNGGDTNLPATKVHETSGYSTEVHFLVYSGELVLINGKDTFVYNENSNVASFLYIFAENVRQIYDNSSNLVLRNNKSTFITLSHVDDVFKYNKKSCNYLSAMDLYKKLTDICDKFVGKIFLGFNGSRVSGYTVYYDENAVTKLNAYLSVLHEYKTGRVYCLIKYPNSNLSIPCSISKTTLKVLTTELPELVKYEQCSSLPKLNFQSLHYHQLILRLGQYRYLGDYKKLKLLYYEYNDTIFGGVLSKQYVVGIFDCTSKSYAASGFQVGGVNHILISAQNFNIQDKFSDNLKMTLMHEMCHAYTEYKYGTAVENEGEGGESVGVTGYYKEHYADQMKYHGKHFKEATILCQEKSKYAWQDIFDYGLALNKWQSSEDTDEDYGRKALAPKNAFNSGQSYRKVYSFNLSNSTFCRQHGIINCKCNSTDKIQLYDGRYLGYCKSCGNIEIFDDSTIGTKGVNPDYFDVIDRYGLVYFTKCNKCGKTHLTPIVADYDDNKSSLANYLSDLNFADRYVNHIWQICEANKSKYKGYFIKNFNCSVKLSRDIMPVLNIEFISEQNTIYKYKFFISCNGKRKPVGKLYRDYDYNYSGYLLHTFRIMTDKDVLLFFNYIMSYVRKDMRKD